LTLDLHALRQRLGGNVYDGGRQWIGPGPGHSRKDRSLHVTIKPDGAAVYCSFANDTDDAIFSHLGLSQRAGVLTDPQARAREKYRQAKIADQELQGRINWCSERWRESQPAANTPVETYLRSRSIALAIPATLRFHPALPRGYGKGLGHPAMVGIIQGPDGAPTGLHATFITPDGSAKSSMAPAKLMFGLARAGCVRLGDPHGGALAVGEGIETCLSYMQLTGTPAYAALSAGNMQAFSPPPLVRRLIVAADGDDAGRQAAQHLLEAERQNRNMTIDAAPDGQDWNDILQMGGANGAL